nr:MULTISPECIES: CPBP family intramembrane glutamic endopeptidase [Halostella]
MNVDAVRRYAVDLSWVQKSLLFGAALTVVWMSTVEHGLDQRVVRDGLIFIVGPLALGLSHGRRIGWRVDRTALRNTVLLALFVLPFYLVGSSLPSIRAFYPMWSTTAAPGEFVPHAIKLFVLALAAETYYRGLLCVGVREIGFKSVFISPVLYAIHHFHKPPIEFLLSGPTDVLFGAVDYESNSILPSVVAHGAGLVLLDWLVLHPPLLPPETVVRWLRWLPLPL